jgi:hypothetical protein
MLNEFEIIPINCVWIEPDELIQRIRQLKEGAEAKKWVYAKVPLDLKRVYYPAPPKGGKHLPRYAVWQPENMEFGSVLIPNYGDCLIQLMRHLNKTFKIRYFSAFLARNHQSTGYCTFTYAETSGAKRIVQVIQDPRWTFFQKGDVLPFENIDYYKRRIIAERLTPDIIEEYLNSLGWNLKAEAFWKSKGQSWLAVQTAFN